MANQKNKGDRHQVLIVFLLFIVLVLISVMVGTFNKINILEKSPVTEMPDIDPVEEEVAESVGKIAIIIDDFGYRNDEISEGFLLLDTHLTYSIIPGHEFSQTMSKKASLSGYEVIAHMPLGTTVPSFGEDESIIKASMTSAEIEARM